MNDAAKPVWFILFVVVGLTAVVFIARNRSAGDGNGLIAWQTDLATAQEQSAKEGKPVLVYFTADWCPPCQQMKKGTWLDSQVAEVVKAKYLPVMIDIDADGQKAVAQRFGVQGIPRVEVIAPNGERRLVTEGYMSPEQMAAALR